MGCNGFFHTLVNAINKTLALNEHFFSFLKTENISKANVQKMRKEKIYGKAHDCKKLYPDGFAYYNFLVFMKVLCCVQGQKGFY